jgi:hypothetical protein
MQNRRSRGVKPERCGSPFLFDRVKKLVFPAATLPRRSARLLSDMGWHRLLARAPTSPGARWILGGFLDHKDTVLNITLFAREVLLRLRELNLEPQKAVAAE